MFRICCLSVICLFQFVYSSDLSQLSLLTQENVELKQKIVCLEEEIAKEEAHWICLCKSVASIAAASLAPYSGPFFTFMAYGIFDALEGKDNDFKTAVYNALPDNAKATGRQAYDIPEPGPANGNWDPVQLNDAFDRAIGLVPAAPAQQA